MRRNALGDCLFAYCFTRILAERFGYRLEATPIAAFRGTRTPVAGDEVLGPIAVWSGHWPFDAHSGRPMARKELYQAPGAHLKLDGCFQRWEFFREYAEVIRHDWLFFHEPLSPQPISEFAICLRLGPDYLPDGEVMPPEEGDGFAAGILSATEIRRLVRTVSHSKLVIITDRPQHAFIESLSDLGAEVFSEGEMTNFWFMASFQKMAFCQNSLHWWAAFLGAAREIYFPKCERGTWSHPEPAKFVHDAEHWGIDLKVTDDERYIYDW